MKKTSMKFVFTKGKEIIQLTPEEARELFEQLRPRFEPIVVKPSEPIYIPYPVPSYPTAIPLYPINPFTTVCQISGNCAT